MTNYKYNRNTDAFKQDLHRKITANVPILYVCTSEQTRLSKLIVEEWEGQANIIGWSVSKGVAGVLNNGCIKKVDLSGLRPEEIARVKNDPAFMQLEGLMKQKTIQDMLAYLESWRPMGRDETCRDRNPVPSFFLLFDFDKFFNEPSIVRGMKELHDTLVASYDERMNTSVIPIPTGRIVLPTIGARTTIIIVSGTKNIPGELQPYISEIDFPLPSIEETTATCETAYTALTAKKPGGPFPPPIWLPTKMTGLTEEQQGVALTEMYVLSDKNLADDEKLKPIVVSLKTGLLKSQGILDYIEPPANSRNNLGGLDNLKRIAIRLNKALNDPRARMLGVLQKATMLLLGPPGVGKTESVNFMADLICLPILSFDFGKILDKWVGSSEQKLEEALKQAVSNAPCILRIDEINRLLSESFGGGNEVTQRLKGKLLTFMQENRAPILIIATANGISMMAQEFIRRFNYLVFVDIPTEDERKQIWTIHLEKKTTEESIERSALNYDLPLLARASDGFTGAEIESVVQKTKLSLLDSEKDDFDTDDLVNQCAMEVPLSMRSKDMLEDLRTWAMAYCTPATWTEGWETRKREALQRLEDMSKAPDTNVRRNRFLGLN